MAKKKKCPEFENHERWLVAFADMMTLLFALFVVLYAIAMVNTSKLKVISESIKTAFNTINDVPNDTTSSATGPEERESIKQYTKGDSIREHMLRRLRQNRIALIARDSKALEEKLAMKIYSMMQLPDNNKAPEDRTIYVENDPDGIRVSLLSREFFAPGSVLLEDKARRFLDGVAEALKDIHRTIRVEGHTDNLPFNKDGMTNWELSGLRAVAATRYLLDTNDVQKGFIYAAAFADSKPLTANDTPQKRAINRRIDIKILYDQLEDYFPKEDDPEFEKSLEE